MRSSNPLHWPGRLLLGILKTIGRLRRWLLARYYSGLVKSRCAEWKPPLRVNGRTLVNRDTWLGRNVNFNGLEIQGEGKVVIGDNFHSGTECLIVTVVHNYDEGESIPYDATNVLKETIIEDNVWLGQRVTILGGARIGEGAIIQAGAVVVSDIPPLGIAGGSPAKVFKERDRAHYERLKAEGRFH